MKLAQNKNINNLIHLFCIWSAVCGTSLAQSTDESGFSASIEAQLANTDNVLGNADEISDNYLTIAPVINLLGITGKQSFSASHKGYSSARLESDEQFRSASLLLC